MRLLPGISVILTLLVAAPAANAAQVNLTAPTNGASFTILDGVLPVVPYAATLVAPPLGCLTDGTWAIERRRNGGAWSRVVFGPPTVLALAKAEPTGSGRYDVRAALRCPGDDPVFSAIRSVRVLAEQVDVPDPPDLPDPPLPDPPDLPLPDTGTGTVPLPPNVGTVQLPGGGTIEVPSTGVIPVAIAGGGGLPSGPGGPVIPLAPGTDDTRLCMIALADLDAVRDMVRSARRAVRRRSSARRRAALRSAKRLLVQARAAEKESCL